MKHPLSLSMKLQMQFLLFALIALIFAPTAFPQSHARITVCVNDNNSSPIVGANLELFRQGISQGKMITGGDGCAAFEVVVTGIDDRDGSPIRSFQLAPVYPNPSSHAINFEMSVPRAGILGYAVYDILGRTLASGSAQAQAGAQALNLDVSALPNGKYFLQLENSAARKVVSFTKIGTGRGGPIRVSITPSAGISLERRLPKKFSFTASNEFMLVASAAGFKTSSLRFAVSQDTTVVFSLAAVAGASCDNLPAELSDINDFIVPNSVSVTQVVVGGIPRRQSELFITFVDDIEICNQDSFELEVMVRNPVDSLLKVFSVAIDTITVLGNQIRLLVNGPITTGAVLTVGRGTLGVGKSFMDAGSFLLEGANLLTPTEATLWIKAVEPNNVDLFTINTYNASPNVVLPEQSNDPNVVAGNLKVHFQKFVDLNRLTRDKADALLQMFWNAANGTDLLLQEAFSDNAGMFQPQLMAMVLANASTIAEQAIDVLFSNVQGRIPKFVYGRPPSDPNLNMEVWISGGRMTIIVNENLKNEPFQVLAPSMAHELIAHQDARRGQDEEGVATIIAVAAWMDQVLVDPSLAALKTAMSRLNNLKWLAFYNSGQLGYPNPGFYTAPLRQEPPNVFPNSNRNSERSFEDVIRKVLYPETPDVNTPGTPQLNAVVSKLTGTPQSGLHFNRQTITLLDNVRVFTPDELFAMLRILRLKFTEESSTQSASLVKYLHNKPGQL